VTSSAAKSKNNAGKVTSSAGKSENNAANGTSSTTKTKKSAIIAGLVKMLCISSNYTIRDGSFRVRSKTSSTDIFSN